MKRRNRFGVSGQLGVALSGLFVWIGTAWGQAGDDSSYSERTDKPDTLITTLDRSLSDGGDLLKKEPHDFFTVSSGGPRSDDEIKEVIRRYQATLNSYYQRELKTNPRLKGTVKIRWTIKPNGVVTTAIITENSVGNSKLAWSIQQCILKWKFKPFGTALHTVDLSIPFEPAL